MECGVSAGQRKNKLRMQIFAGEYLQDREKASCGCKFLQESICKRRKNKLRMQIFAGEYLQAEKKQVADVLFVCGVSASREKASRGYTFCVWSICKIEKK